MMDFKCTISKYHLRKRIFVLMPFVCAVLLVIHINKLIDGMPPHKVNKVVLYYNKSMISRESIRSALYHRQLATKEQIEEYIDKSRSLTIKPKQIHRFSNAQSPCWGKYSHIYCLPYFHFAGFDKCGTTDLFTQMTKHPQIVFNNPYKEINWWTVFRFQDLTARFQYIVQPEMSFYLSTIKRYGQPLMYKASGFSRPVQLITGDSSLDLIWKQRVVPGMAEDYNAINPFSTNLSEAIREFRLLHIHVVHEYTPHAKYIIMMRDPVSRLWSDYLFSKHLEKHYTGYTRTPISQKDFHEGVVNYLGSMEECLRTKDIRYCSYYANSWPGNTTRKDMRLNSNIRLHVGLYVIYIYDLLQVVPREKVLLINYHQYIRNKTPIIKRVFEFLDAKDSDFIMSQVNLTSKVNSRHKGVNVGEMWKNTSQILQQFYKPFNEELARFTDDKSYLFDELIQPRTQVDSS